MAKSTEASPSRIVPSGWIERIEAVHAPGYMNWITSAWATMLIKQGIVPAEHTARTARGVLELWQRPDVEPRTGPHMYNIDRYFIDTLGEEAGGRLMIARTQPSSRQMLEVRHHLMKQMCNICDLLEALLDLAARHTGTVMPGYTHTRHAQPTTFGHYLVSVHDPIARGLETLESAWHLMNLCEMGCGALAGTSWPIDRDLVSRYLGMEGLLENANDAVAYADGFLVVVCGLTNITNVISRASMDLAHWSGHEYGFLEIGGIRGASFMMPQKSNNPNGFEQARVAAGQMIGHLAGTAAAPLRSPHADVFEMLHMADPTLAALEAAGTCMARFVKEIRGLGVYEERMLAVIRESYIAATELANQLVRDLGLSYRTAHKIVHQFVIASERQGIPATQARAAMLDEAAEEIIDRKTGLTDARLRELLDPVYFVRVTDSRGGVAPAETARMIAARRENLRAACGRHVERIETLEQAQARMEADLRALGNG